MCLRPTTPYPIRLTQDAQSSAESRDNSKASKSAAKQPSAEASSSAAAAATPSITLDAFKNRMKTEMAQYVDSNDMNEVKLTLEETNAAAFHAHLVSTAIDFVFDKSKPEVAASMGNLLVFLYENKVITPAHVRDGVLDVIEFLEVSSPLRHRLCVCVCVRVSWACVVAPLG